MGKKTILIVNGHPDPSPKRFCAALAQAYAEGAEQGGHVVRRLDVGALDFPLIRSHADFEDTDPPLAIRQAQEDFLWAEHIVLVYPLWLGASPALLKGFLEQTFRYGFALPRPGEAIPRGRLAGRSARLIVTMGMPGAVYWSIFGAFGVRSMERGILWISGFRPIRHSFVGSVESSAEDRLEWLGKVKTLGRKGH